MVIVRRVAYWFVYFGISTAAAGPTQQGEEIKAADIIWNALTSQRGRAG